MTVGSHVCVTKRFVESMNKWRGVHQRRYHYRVPQSRSTVKIFNPCTSLPDVCQYLVLQTAMDNMSKDMPSTPMTHVACESKLRSVARSSMHPCPVNWVTIGRAVVYYAGAAQAFSVEIKRWHCTSLRHIVKVKPQYDISHDINMIYCITGNVNVLLMFPNLPNGSETGKIKTLS